MDSFHSASDLIKIRRGAVMAWRRASPPAYDDASIYTKRARELYLYSYLTQIAILYCQNKKSNQIKITKTKVK